MKYFCLLVFKPNSVFACQVNSRMFVFQVDIVILQIDENSTKLTHDIFRFSSRNFWLTFEVNVAPMNSESLRRLKSIRAQSTLHQHSSFVHFADVFFVLGPGIDSIKYFRSLERRTLNCVVDSEFKLYFKLYFNFKLNRWKTFLTPESKSNTVVFCVARNSESLKTFRIYGHFSSGYLLATNGR